MSETKTFVLPEQDNNLATMMAMNGGMNGMWNNPLNWWADLKPRELLETPIKDNQQPSSLLREGSTTIESVGLKSE